jgi:hypothetical protein
LKKKKHNDVNKVEKSIDMLSTKKHKSKARTYKQRTSSSFKALKISDGK